MINVPSLEKISRGVGRTLNALSPIELFNGQQLNKLNATHRGFTSFFQGLQRTIEGNMKIVDANLATAKGLDAQLGGLGGYMRGHNIGELRGSLDKSTQAFRSKVRGRAAMAGGVYAATSLGFGSDSAIPSTMRTAATVGMHGGIAMGLSRFAHPMAGVAYAGLGIFNAYRRGDNIGPF